MTDYVWVRRADEPQPAYDAFRTFLLAGTRRNLNATAEATGKSIQAIKRYSTSHDWLDRAKAYDAHTMRAETDGLTNRLATNRDANLELVDKLRRHLSHRLDDFVASNTDPTVRWTQALAAMAKLEANAFTMRDDPKTSERVERIEALVERALGMEVDG